MIWTHAHRIGRRKQKAPICDEAFGSRAKVDPGNRARRPALAAAHAEEPRAKHGHGADAQTEAAPDPLDDALLDERVDHAHAEHTVDVLDQGKVAALDQVLLRLRAAQERDFLGVLEQARVREAVLALKSLLLGGVAAKRRRR